MIDVRFTSDDREVIERCAATSGVPYEHPLPDRIQERERLREFRQCDNPHEQRMPFDEVLGM
jgi:hypothetical protein